MTRRPTAEQRRRAIELRETTDLSFTDVGRLTGLSKHQARGIVVRAQAAIMPCPPTKIGVAPRTAQAKRLCQWIYGEPKPGQRWVDMDKCSDPALFGGSYCELHAGRATQPGKPRPL